MSLLIKFKFLLKQLSHKKLNLQKVKYNLSVVVLIFKFYIYPQILIPKAYSDKNIYFYLPRERFVEACNIY